MSKAERLRAQDARQKILARRAAARRAETRRRTLIAGGCVALVLLFVIVLVVTRLTRSPAAPAGSAKAVASVAITRGITTVPAAAFDRVGAGTASGLKAITGQPELTAHGKPELLYMGGEFCPYCAAERWVIAAAVSRFGTLAGLHFIHSSPIDAYPSTPTLSFYGSTYSSKYLDFVPVEWYGERQDPSTPFQHVYLQHPTPRQVALFTDYANGSIPLVDIGNRYLVPQTQYVPSALANLGWAQVTAAMHDPSGSVGKDIDGATNMITAAICELTRGEPGNVCASAGVRAARGSI